MSNRRHVTIKPPPGRPYWEGGEGSPLIYLGWGKRDFSRAPVARHYDIGTNIYVVLKGDLVLSIDGEFHSVVAPKICVIDRECLYGITHGKSATVEVLVWVWRERPEVAEVAPPVGGFRLLNLPPAALPQIIGLHQNCRAEVAQTQPNSNRVLGALRTWVDVAVARAHAAQRVEKTVQWDQVKMWITTNLAIHAPVPALCDYLGLSASTLNRLFMKQEKMAPGAYFREAKRREAVRLIQVEGWTVKAAAFHLGYRHATDLSRVLAKAKAPGRKLKTKRLR